MPFQNSLSICAALPRCKVGSRSKKLSKVASLSILNTPVSSDANSEALITSSKSNKVKVLKRKEASINDAKNKDKGVNTEHISKVLKEDRPHLEIQRERLVRLPAAYHLFMKEKRALLAVNTSQLETLWKSLSAEEKQKYVLEAATLQQQFEERKKLLTAAQKSGLAELKDERKLKKLKRLGSVNRKKELSVISAKYRRPKKPTVLGVLKAEIWNALGRIPDHMKLKALVTRWNSMSSDEKQKYHDKARTNFILYKKQLAAWEEKMTASGHQDLVEKFHTLNYLSFLSENDKLPDGQQKKRKRVDKNLSHTENRPTFREYKKVAERTQEQTSQQKFSLVAEPTTITPKKLPETAVWQQHSTSTVFDATKKPLLRQTNSRILTVKQLLGL